MCCPKRMQIDRATRHPRVIITRLLHMNSHCHAINAQFTHNNNQRTHILLHGALYMRDIHATRAIGRCGAVGKGEQPDESDKWKTKLHQAVPKLQPPTQIEYSNPRSHAIVGAVVITQTGTIGMYIPHQQRLANIAQSIDGKHAPLQYRYAGPSPHNATTHDANFMQLGAELGNGVCM